MLFGRPVDLQKGKRIEIVRPHGYRIVQKEILLYFGCVSGVNRSELSWFRFSARAIPANLTNQSQSSGRLLAVNKVHEMD